MNRHVLAALAAILTATGGQAAVTRHLLPAGADGKPARILESVEVGPGATTLYLSGQLASPIDPNKPMGPGLSAADVGDTRTQTVSALGKIRTILAARGYSLADVIKMTVFVAPDPRLGRMDFDGMNAGFAQFFNTPDNPNTVARSAFQVGALALPAFLVEIEVIAAKAR